MINIYIWVVFFEMIIYIIFKFCNHFTRLHIEMLHQIYFCRMKDFSLVLFESPPKLLQTLVFYLALFQRVEFLLKDSSNNFHYGDYNVLTFEIRYLFPRTIHYLWTFHSPYKQQKVIKNTFLNIKMELLNEIDWI